MYTIDVLAQAKVIKEARGLLGVHEIPNGSNRGPAVETIQHSTGAIGEPWCVSYLQYVWHWAFGEYLADRTANAYYLADWAKRMGYVIPQPVVGGLVVYLIGDGHCGIVASVRGGGEFDALEGNEANAVRWMLRDPAKIQCTFILPPALLAKATPKAAPMVVPKKAP